MPRLSPPEIKSTAQLRDLQRLMTSALFRPLTVANRMQTRWVDGRSATDVTSEFIKPNAQLTSFERLEIYNRQYWFRILDSFSDDFPGLCAVLGERRFMKLAEAYLVKYPSASFTLRNLGSRLERFLRHEPQWAGNKLQLALDVVRFEWAQINTFDGASEPAIEMKELLLIDPSKLRFGLQPYVTLLALDYPVDDFVLGLKHREALRGEASNAKESAPKVARLKKVPLPKPEKVYVAIHRHNNDLYYKRLEPEAFRLLNALGKGVTLEVACERAFRRASRRINWGPRIEKWFENWSALGWFCRSNYMCKKIAVSPTNSP